MKVIVVKTESFGKQRILVDDEDFEMVSAVNWSIRCRPYKCGNRFYAFQQEWVGEKLIQTPIANFILDLPRGQEVDHRDRNGLNNQRSNLRPCTRSQNLANRDKSPNKSSRYRGVIRKKWTGSYEARICVNYQRILLGTFSRELDAAIAYDEAAKQYFGEFANLNFPKGVKR